MSDRVLTEEEVRGILATTYENHIVRSIVAKPSDYPRTLLLFGLNWDGTHYRESPDA